MAFLGDAVSRYGLSCRSILEAGSLNVNGSPRGLFAGAYHGIDLQAGKGVDEVLPASEAGAKYPGRFQVILSTEMLEHDPEPWLSLASLSQCVPPRGLLLLTARGFDQRGSFPVHGYPLDCWRFSCDGMRELLKRTGWEPQSVLPDPDCPGVFAVATRP
jgi:hypothetical protein